LRTYPGSLLVLIAPALVAADAAVWVVAVRGGWAHEKARATRELIGWLPRLARERRAIQSERTISAGEFAAGLISELSSPYLGGLTESSRLRAALGAYWAFVRWLLRSPRG